MNVGDVYYRKIDNCECKIRGFFFLYNDGSPSSVYSSLLDIKHQEVKRNKQLHVLFTDDTFDTVDNLYTQLYLSKQDHDKIQKHIQKMENADGLWSALDLAIHFPQPTISYKSIPEQESHVEAYWDNNDFVPNPGEKPKRFKLW